MKRAEKCFYYTLTTTQYYCNTMLPPSSPLQLPLTPARLFCGEFFAPTRARVGVERVRQASIARRSTRKAVHKLKWARARRRVESCSSGGTNLQRTRRPTALGTLYGSLACTQLQFYSLFVFASLSMLLPLIRSTDCTRAHCVKWHFFFKCTKAE